MFKKLKNINQLKYKKGTDNEFFQQVLNLPQNTTSEITLQNNFLMPIQTSFTSNLGLPKLSYTENNTILQLDNPKIIPSECTYFSPLNISIFSSNMLEENNNRIIYTVDNSKPDLVTNLNNTKIYNNKPITC